MRHNFYVMFNNHGLYGKLPQASTKDHEKRKERNKRRNITVELRDKALSDRINKLLNAYSNDEVSQSEILTHVSMFQCNMTIAKEYRDRKAQKRLEEELINYICKKENEMEEK